VLHVGTTGYSKGVIYSHRALVLHSFACGLGEVFGMGHFDTVLPVAPMFHANAWGLPFACTMLGARLVLPVRVSIRKAFLALWSASA